MPSNLPSPDALIEEILSSSKYRAIHPDLARRLVAQELAKGRSAKEVVKEVRAKLHQVGSAYQETPIAYAKLIVEMDALPHDAQDPSIREFCLRCLQGHASTRERLPILDTFFTEALAPLGPIHSVLDLACGLTPLTLPWMPLADDVSYHACDIYADMIGFINHWFEHIHMPGQASLCDLTASVPAQPVQLALLLKTLPCLEQVDKSAPRRLLDGLQAEHILISFPVASLGGHSKGMRQNYEARFLELTADWKGSVQRFEFKTELAFLLSRA